MKERILNHKAKKIISRYKTYSNYAANATNKDKKIVFENTLLKANKLQKKTASS